MVFFGMFEENSDQRYKDAFVSGNQTQVDQDV